MLVVALTASVVTVTAVMGVVWCLPCKLTLVLGKKQ